MRVVENAEPQEVKVTIEFTLPEIREIESALYEFDPSEENDIRVGINYDCWHGFTNILSAHGLDAYARTR